MPWGVLGQIVGPKGDKGDPVTVTGTSPIAVTGTPEAGFAASLSLDSDVLNALSVSSAGLMAKVQLISQSPALVASGSPGLTFHLQLVIDPATDNKLTESVAGLKVTGTGPTVYEQATEPPTPNPGDIWIVTS